MTTREIVIVAEGRNVRQGRQLKAEGLVGLSGQAKLVIRDLCNFRGIGYCIHAGFCFKLATSYWLIKDDGRRPYQHPQLHNRD